MAPELIEAKCFNRNLQFGFHKQSSSFSSSSSIFSDYEDDEQA
jgi:hypothetical protein